MLTILDGKQMTGVFGGADLPPHSVLLVVGDHLLVPAALGHTTRKGTRWTLTLKRSTMIEETFIF